MGAETRNLEIISRKKKNTVPPVKFLLMTLCGEGRVG